MIPNTIYIYRIRYMRVKEYKETTGVSGYEAAALWESQSFHSLSALRPSAALGPKK